MLLLPGRVLQEDGGDPVLETVDLVTMRVGDPGWDDVIHTSEA